MALPGHLKVLANTSENLVVSTDQIPTITEILNRLEVDLPQLKGTIRDINSKKRRPFIRYFFEDEDFSDFDQDAAVPDDIAFGIKTFYIVGSMSGG